jgi:hypothetical protein
MIIEIERKIIRYTFATANAIRTDKTEIKKLRMAVLTENSETLSFER